MRWNPHDYQREGAKFLVRRRAAGLFLKPGRGKTSITLAAFMAARKATQFKGAALVVAPLRVAYDTWAQRGEVGLWDQFAGLRVALLHGSKRDAALESEADLYVINFDGLEWLGFGIEKPDKPLSSRNPSRLDQLMERTKIDFLVVDELSKFKHLDTQRFKAIKPHLPHFGYRWGLTGSPVANSLENIFGETYVLDLGAHFGQYITHFRNRFFYPVGNPKWFQYKPQPDAKERIFDTVKDLFLVVDGGKSYEPEIVTNNIWVDLPAEVRAFYDELEEELIADIFGVDIVAASAGALSMKCRQIASGGIYRNDLGQSFKTVKTKLGSFKIVKNSDRECLHLHDAKTEALRDLVEELQGQPCMVSIEFEHDRERIRKMLGKDIPSIDGDCSHKEAAKIFAAWNSGDVPVMLVHPQTAGHGLNLQKSNCANFVFYSTPWDRELYDQVIARVCRQGNQSETVVVHRLLARNTVEDSIVQTIGTKGETETSFLEALRAYAATKRKARK